MLIQGLLLTLLPLVSAQAYGGPAQSSSSAASSSSSAAAAPSQSGVHAVTVGAGGAFVFQPDSITAAVGEKVVFSFQPGSHSVAESTFAAPCSPSTPGVFSGFMQPTTGSGGQVFVLTVNSTNPIWLYCSQIGHCNAGMAMVINPPSGANTLAAYKSAAANAKLVSPTVVQGGVVEAASAVSSGSASSSSAASTTSASPSPSPSKGAGSRYGLDALAVIGAGVLGFAML